MPRKGENIYKRKDGRWEGRYIRERVDGKARYGTVYGKSYREVKEKLDAIKKELEERNLAAAQNAGKVREMGNRWLEEAAVTLKESSINKYKDILSLYIYPELGDAELSEITNQQVTDFMNLLLSTGGSKQQGLSPATVAEVLSTMNSIRVYALRNDHRVVFTSDCIDLKREQGDIRVFSLEEEETLLQYLQANLDLTALGILVCLYTGIRVGELCAMSWDDISLSECKMHVCKTMQRVRVNASEGGRTEVKAQKRLLCPHHSPAGTHHELSGRFPHLGNLPSHRGRQTVSGAQNHAEPI